MHLDRLESAGLVVGNLELSDDGKAMKYFELVPFALAIDAELIATAVRTDEAEGGPVTGPADSKKGEKA
jgi:hypothetical protein